VLGKLVACTVQPLVEFAGNLSLLDACCTACGCVIPCSSCSLSVNAEPFGNPAQPVALDLLHLPKGLTQLELRNIDVTTSPAAFMAAANGHAYAAGDSAGSARFQQPSGAVFVAVAGCSSGAAAAMNAHDQQQQQPAAAGMLPLPGMGGEAAAVLGQLACLKLESCRLRTRQLQVRLCCCR
jgi:hypothetical protein